MEEQRDPELHKLHTLAQELWDAQRRENDGAGIEAVRLIVEELRYGKLQEARRTADWKWIELQRYPIIRELLEEKLF